MADSDASLLEEASEGQGRDFLRRGSSTARDAADVLRSFVWEVAISDSPTPEIRFSKSDLR